MHSVCVQQKFANKNAHLLLSTPLILMNNGIKIKTMGGWASGGVVLWMGECAAGGRVVLDAG